MLQFIARNRLFRQCLATWILVWIALPHSMVVVVVRGNPTGGTVSSGSAQITGSPGNVTVQQSSQRAIVKWNDFSINQGETTTFVQPNSQSATLNRVTGGNTSQIHGALNANGKVYLVNPNGVVIGKTGRVNTASFTASTHDVNDAEFLNGGDMTFRGNSGASVINQGRIRATDGDVTLIAKRVENSGKIRAKNGSVNLAGGMEVLVKPSGDGNGQRVFIRSSSGSGTVENSGSIRATAAELRAAGGNEYALAINNSGTIRATAVDKSGGRIVLKAERPEQRDLASSGRGGSGGGIVKNSGSLIARASSKAPDKDGGRIDITGEKVHLAAGSRVDASGGSRGKGGVVNIGGGFQGRDATVANAKVTVVDQGAVIQADGGIKGGHVVVWSDQATGFYGDISARGPGDRTATSGGAVEVSSGNYLDFRGTVDTSGGTLLLDPSNIEIGNVATVTGFVDPNSTNLVSNAANSYLYNGWLGYLLTLGNVTVQTSASPAFSANPGLMSTVTGNTLGGDIWISSGFTYSTPFSLTLLAHGDIIMSGSMANVSSISVTPGATAGINLVAGWSGSNTTFADIVADPVGYGTSANGSVYINHVGLGSTVFVGSQRGDTNVAGYNIFLRGSDVYNGYAMIGYPAAGATGNTSIYARNNVSLTGGAADFVFAQIGNGGATTVGTFSGNILVRTGGALQLNGGSSTATYARIGHGGDAATLIAFGNITISSGGLIQLRGGSTNFTSAVIGHGGSVSGAPVGPLTGNISVQGSGLDMEGGSGGYALAQIGHGGTLAQASAAGGNITVTISGGVTLRGSAGTSAYAQIGHGGVRSSYTNGASGNILLTAASLTLNSGTGPYTYAMVGHGGMDIQYNSIAGQISIDAQSVAMNGFNAPVRIGHGGATSITSPVPAGVPGGITGDIIFGSGTRSLLMTAGSATGIDPAFVQIGHGGALLSVGTVSGNIQVYGSDNITLTGGTASAAYAQIGHGGVFFQGASITGNIAVNGGTTSVISLIAGPIQLGNAQIGHGGGQAIIPGTLLGNVTISGRSVSLTASQDPLSPISTAQIGHGGYLLTTAGIFGDISVAYDTSVTILAGRGISDYALIGHGGESGVSGSSGISGNIVVTGNGVVSIQGGRETSTPSQYSFAQIGHGGYLNRSSSLQGNVRVTGNSIFLNGGDCSYGYAKIGHTSGGFYTAYSGDIDLDFSSSLSLLAGNNLSGSFVQVGHGTFYIAAPVPAVASSVTGDIRVAGGAGSSILIAGGGASANYALLGHGGIMHLYTSTGAAGIIQGNIDIATGSMDLRGGVSNASFAQVGHFVPSYDLGIAGLSTAGNPLLGYINIGLTGNLTMVGGTGNGTYAMIGHGGVTLQTFAGPRSGQIILRVGGETSLVDGAKADALWWIGHLTRPGDAITDADILFQTNTLDYSATSTSDTNTVNSHFARTLANLVHGNLTFLSTNTEGGLIIEEADPNTDVHANFTLSMLSRGDFTIDAPIVNTGTPGSSGASAFFVAGFDGTSGILSVPGGPLVDTSRFTAASTHAADLTINAAGLHFGDSITLVAGRSIRLDFDSDIEAGNNFTAIVDNFNTTRPNFSSEAYFYNLGRITAGGDATLYAVSPELVNLGDFASLGSGRATNIWFGDSDAIVGANFKLVPSISDDPTLGFQDNPDDRFRKPRPVNARGKGFSIYYSQTTPPGGAGSLLWLNSYSVVPSASFQAN